MTTFSRRSEAGDRHHRSVHRHRQRSAVDTLLGKRVIRRDVLAWQYGLNERQLRAVAHLLENGRLTVQDCETLRPSVHRRTLQSEHEQLAVLQQQADLVMLRKARAAILLRFRGKRVPTLAELSQLTATDA